MSFNDIFFWATGPNSILFYMNVPHNALFQKCINGSAPPNRRTARAPDMKSFNWHLLNHWHKFNIILQNCSLWCTLPKLHKWFYSTDQSCSCERPSAQGPSCYVCTRRTSFGQNTVHYTCRRMSCIVDHTTIMLHKRVNVVKATCSIINCIATWFAMSGSFVKLTAIGTSLEWG